MHTNFDIIIIGGGATGLGCAIEAASRGYKTLLVEAYDYGKGTSSKSSKLLHGGIRYLANFDLPLVYEGLAERYYLLNNAPHLAAIQPFLIPLYTLRQKIKYYLGVKLYDLLALKRKLGKSKLLTKAQTIAAAPQLNSTNLIGSALYFDGKVDDSRLLISLVATLASLGGTALNYHQVTAVSYSCSGRINGVICNNNQATFRAKYVINATGTFSDNLLDLAEPNYTHANCTFAQGSHLVFAADAFSTKHAILLPETSDGRVLFIIPWREKVIVGTTDVSVIKPSLEPKVLASEIDFILDTINHYATRQLTSADILAIFCGQRPLVKPQNNPNSAKISRKHRIFVSHTGLINVIGGKLTIYRRMGEDAIDYMEKIHGLVTSKSISKNLRLSGYSQTPLPYPLSVYGSKAPLIQAICKELNNFARLSHDLPYFQAEVIYQVRYEQAKTIEDVLARRTRALFLNARAAINSAELVAQLMANELGQDEKWQREQIAQFTQTAQNFLPN